MNSNIEPLARDVAVRICRREGMPEAEIAAWVELHWPCAAAMLEAGLMDERRRMGAGPGHGAGL